MWGPRSCFAKPFPYFFHAVIGKLIDPLVWFLPAFFLPFPLLAFFHLSFPRSLSLYKRQRLRTCTFAFFYQVFCLPRVFPPVLFGFVCITVLPIVALDLYCVFPLYGLWKHKSFPCLPPGSRRCLQFNFARGPLLCPSPFLAMLNKFHFAFGFFPRVSVFFRVFFFPAPSSCCIPFQPKFASILTAPNMSLEAFLFSYRVRAFFSRLPWFSAVPPSSTFFFNFTLLSLSASIPQPPTSLLFFFPFSSFFCFF